MIFEKKHENFMKKFGYDLVDLQKLTNDNLGYMTGTTCDGIPFDAKYFTNGEDVTIAIYIPVFKNRNLEEHKDAKFASGISGFQYENKSQDNSIMDIGMVDGGMEDDDEIVHAYVNYLEDAGLIRFTTDMCNGCVYYRIMAGLKFDESRCPYNIDYPSNQIIYIISLKENAEKAELARLHKFARMSGYPFKIVLVKNNDNLEIGFAFYGEKNEQEEMAGTMQWIVSLHDDWILCDCQEKMPRIEGVRMANNPFHARKILLQGERLD